jgi:polyisoprenoid-binding protein YceI
LKAIFENKIEAMTTRKNILTAKSVGAFAVALLFGFAPVQNSAREKFTAEKLATEKLTAIKGESKMSYALSHPLHKIDASTKELSCEIELSDSKEISSVKFSADVMTFDSGNSNRDSHAMEVIDAISYPDVLFQSTSVKADGEKLDVVGNLTFHGVSKSVSFSTSRKISGGKMIIDGAATISLTAFKIDRPALLAIRVDDDLKISFVMTFAAPKS